MTKSHVVSFGMRPVSLSIIVPVYNEQAVLRKFYQRLSDSLEAVPVSDVEILFINDGSKDETMRLLHGMLAQDRRIRVIEFSRNFGKEAAMTAGLDYARGDAAVIIDADLQDPPELIADMVREWQKGCDVVIMRRLDRKGESGLRKITAKAFYRLIGRSGSFRVPEDVGDFRLLSRLAIDALKRMPERTRFMKGLFAWIGFSTREIGYLQDARWAGKSKWNYWSLWNLAIEGITSVSVAPLKIAGYIGILVCIVAFFTGISTDTAPVGTAFFSVLLFIGGLQLLAVGIVGEYLARLFIEAKRRPRYLVNRHYQSAADKPMVNFIRRGEIGHEQG